MADTGIYFRTEVSIYFIVGLLSDRTAIFYTSTYWKWLA